MTVKKKAAPQRRQPKAVFVRVTDDEKAYLAAGAESERAELAKINPDVKLPLGTYVFTAAKDRTAQRIGLTFDEFMAREKRRGR